MEWRDATILPRQRSNDVTNRHTGNDNATSTQRDNNVAKKKPPVLDRGQVNREASRLGDAGAKDPFPATRAGMLMAEPP